MRDVLTSRFEGGKIMQFDYVSLEPRVALILSGQDPEKDIYTELCKKVLDGKYGRQTAKLLTIATLYGMGARRVKELLGVSKHSALEVLKKLEIFFGVGEIKAHLEEEAKGGFIKNYFGRNIRVRNDASHVLYNNYIQSSAMDAALEGFYKIVQGVAEQGHQCVPLFLLHDAIIFDCHPECFDKLGDIMSPGQTLSAFDSCLYMGAEEL
jgi:DNA polymerase I-like protein with 3'-5' exonuclease and polymerase domains